MNEHSPVTQTSNIGPLYMSRCDRKSAKSLATIKLNSTSYCHFKKGSPYSIAERRVPELIPVLGCHYFPPGLQLPPQPLRGLLPVLLLGEQRHEGCEQFAYKTVTRHRRGCDLNAGPTAPESSTLTTRLPSHPNCQLNSS